MKKMRIITFILVVIGFTSSSFKNVGTEEEKSCNKDSMQVVMRFELKVMPDKVAFLKQSFDSCKAKVLAEESGCLDYSLFQSYSDSTRFCLTETWANKAHHNAHMQLAHTKKHIAETSNIHDPSFKSKTNYVYWICPEANKKE